MYLFMKASYVVLRSVRLREEPLTKTLKGIVWNKVDLQR